MNTKLKIPSEPLDINYTSTGFLPDTALHKRGNRIIQECSYSCPVYFTVALVASIMACFLPWNGSAKYILAGGILWSGLCVMIYYIIRIGFCQTVTVNKDKGTLIIKKANSETIIPESEITGLQICYHKLRSANNSQDLSGYQLNLVRQMEGGNYVAPR